MRTVGPGPPSMTAWSALGQGNCSTGCAVQTPRGDDHPVEMLHRNPEVGPVARGNAAPMGLLTGLSAIVNRWERCTETRTVALPARGDAALIDLLTALGATRTRWERCTETRTVSLGARGILHRSPCSPALAPSPPGVNATPKPGQSASRPGEYSTGRPAQPPRRHNEPVGMLHRNPDSCLAGQGEYRTVQPTHRPWRQPQPVGTLHRSPCSPALAPATAGGDVAPKPGQLASWPRGNTAPIALFTGLGAVAIRWERCTETRPVSLEARGIQHRTAYSPALAPATAGGDVAPKPGQLAPGPGRMPHRSPCSLSPAGGNVAPKPGQSPPGPRESGTDRPTHQALRRP